MIAVVLALLFGFLVGCVFEGCRRGGTVDLNAEIALLREPECLSWAERYQTPCENGCLTSPSGHAEGCPVHCGCYDELPASNHPGGAA